MAPAVFPRFGIYDNKFRLGAYGMTGDRWDDVLLLSGFWVAPTTKDYDAFVLFEERHLLPFPLTLDFMRKVLHTDQDTVFSHRLSIDQITYGLNSMQISVQPRIKDWRLDIHSMYQLYDAEVGQTLSYEDAFGRWIVTDQGYNYTYYRGVSLGAAFSYPALKPFTTRDIGPQGWRVRLTYDRWWNWFFDEFDTGSGLLTEDYKPYHYNRFGLDGGLYVPMPWHDEHTLGFEGGASLIDAKVDSFFYEGIGGIIGLRGYTYYQLQGPRTLWMRGLYRLPVPGLGKMNTEVGPFYLDKTYIALFAEAGRVWRDDYTNSWTRGFKRDIGVELRLDMFSFYGFPSRVSFSAVHALDPQPGTDKNKFYLTVLFGYL